MAEDLVGKGVHAGSAFTPSNSFWRASIYNTITNKSELYKTVSQRHSYYAFAQNYLDWDNFESRWFGAAALVTQFNAVGGVDFNGSRMLLSSTARSFLGKGNEFLFEHNMDNFNSILNGNLGKKSFVSANGESISFKGLSGKELDYALVEYEQSLVQDYIEQHAENNPRATIDAIEEVNGLFNLPLAPKDIRDVMEKSFTDESGNLNFDFSNYNHRVQLGQELIDKSYEESE